MLILPEVMFGASGICIYMWLRLDTASSSAVLNEGSQASVDSWQQRSCVCSSLAKEKLAVTTTKPRP